MEYPAIVQFDDGEWVIVFPDCSGCQTQVESETQILPMAQEALEGWLESHLEHGEAPPKPAGHRAPKGAKLIRVPIHLTIAVQLLLRWARQEAGLSQGEVAKRMGVKQPRIAKLERPGSNPSLETIERIVEALGLRLKLELDPSRGRASLRPQSSIRRWA